MPLFNQLAGARHNRQRAQAEKVDFEQAQRLNDRHFKLGHRLDRAVFGARGWAVERDIIDQPAHR